MTNKKCFEKHFHARQGICLAERYQNKLFSVAVQEDYCHECGKVRDKWFIFWNFRFPKLFKKRQSVSLNFDSDLPYN